MQAKATWLFGMFVSGFVQLHLAEARRLGALWNMALMGLEVIDCGLDPFPIPYGCWCGFNDEATSPPPINQFDAACMHHDHCYDAVAANYPQCAGLHMYDSNYEFKVVKSSTSTKQVVCLDDEKHNLCGRKYCECDKTIITKLAKLSREQGCQKRHLKCHGHRQNSIHHYLNSS